MSGQVDALYAFLLGVALFFGSLIAGLEIFFAIRYRRRIRTSFPSYSAIAQARDCVDGHPIHHGHGDFVWGAKLYFDIYRERDGGGCLRNGQAMDVAVSRADGRREINELHVPVGQKIKLILSQRRCDSQFLVPAFRSRRM